MTDTLFESASSSLLAFGTFGSTGKDSAAGREALDALAAEPPDGVRWLRSVADLRASLPGARRRYPISLLPVGVTTEGDVLALDLCAEAAERGRLPVLASRDDRFFRHVAPSLGVFVQAASREALAQEPFTLPFAKARKRAPTSFELHARAAVAARAASDASEEAARIVAALRRPLYSAADIDQIGALLARAPELEGQGFADPLTLRLGRAGLDGAAWRNIGAERAIAGRTQDALRAIEGALFLGADEAETLAVLTRLHARMRFGWGPPVMALRSAVCDA